MTVLGDGPPTLYDPGPVPGPGGWPVTYEQVATGSLPVVEAPLVPRLSAGLRLHGEYQGSGFTEPKYIARRGTGRSCSCHGCCISWRRPSTAYATPSRSPTG